jgi:hypothetical protein
VTATIRSRWLAAALGLAAALLLAAQAGAQAPVAPTRLVFEGSGPTRVKGQLALAATLNTADGKPLGDRPVEFYLQVEFFGRRDAHIGTATTDSTGRAAIVFEPSELGRQTVLAYFPGAAGYASAQTTAAIDVAVVEPAFEAEPLPLALVSRWLPFVLGAVVLATWVALLGTLLGTTARIRAAIHAPAAEEEVAAVPAAGSAARR